MAKYKSDFDEVTCILPTDIQNLILIKVPTWNVIISDNEFKKIHHDESKALGREKLLLLIVLMNLDIMSKGIFLPRKFRKAKVLCSCDGLVLLKNPMAYKTYVLWNLSTREYKTLACPYFNYKGKVSNACGIFYDSTVDDYMIILIYKWSYGMYSLKNDCWTKKTSSISHHVLHDCSLNEGISTGGCVYWTYTYYDNIEESNFAIIYFDGKSDELKELLALNYIKDNDFFGLTTILKDCLSLYASNHHSLELEIWIMEQDGWKLLTKVCNLPPTICKRFIKDTTLLCCTRNGEFVFQKWIASQVFIYNPRQQLLTKFQISKNRIFRVISTCLDSLYFSSFKVERTRKRKRKSATCLFG
ncbi:hypothetical protein R3W88_025795 [Solanum pinnatisectum]|uniref:F-box associated beta-propeller type 1 domain-containing protein n=1 Tax=Solanum pinnatisectum TaxID=50273 RepID=A0AAV9M7Y0_9SOLN|nr:hypothetical protein R3W88_025795 [Solanum pinnatisectum]